MSQNVSGPPEFESLDWVAAVEEFLRSKRKLAPRTVDFYRAQLRLLVTWAIDNKISIEKFTKRHLDAYDVFREKEGSSLRPTQKGHGVGANTRRHDAVCAKQLFRFCHVAGYLERNPLADVVITRPKRRRISVPTEDEIILLLAAYENYYDPQKHPPVRNVDPKRRLLCRRRNVAILKLLIETAARISELLNIAHRDMDFKNNRILLRVTKSGEERFVPCKRHAQGAISEWLRVRPKSAGREPDDLIFINGYGGMVDYGDFNKTFALIREFAGLRHFTLHGIRHYALSCLGHVDLVDTMLIAGHKDPKTTMIYQNMQFDHATSSHDEAAPLERLFSTRRALKERKPRLF